MRVKAFLLMACVGLAGCSTYQGVKLSPAGAPVAMGRRERQAAQKLQMPLGGVPYVLTRPMFSPVKDDKGQYSLNVSYVPDPTQRYAIRMSPSTLAKIGFSMTWDEQGALSALNGSTEEQVTPTVVALLNVVGGVANIAGTLTAAFTPKAAAPAAAPHGLIRPLAAPKPPRVYIAAPPADPDTCLDKPAYAAAITCALLNSQNIEVQVGRAGLSAVCDAPAVAALARRLEDFTDLEGAEKGDALGSLYGAGDAQSACLIKAADVLDLARKARGKALYASAVAAYDATQTNPDPDSAASLTIKARLLRFYETADLTAARKLIAASARLDATADSHALIDRELGLTTTAPGLDLQRALAAAFVAGDLTRAKGVLPAPFEKAVPFPAGRGVVRLARADKAVDALKDGASLDAQAWLRRRLLDLDHQKAQAVTQALITHPSQDPYRRDRTVRTLRDQQVAAVGLSREQARRDAIEIKLRRDLPRINGPARLSPSAEYLALRAEADRLDGAIANGIERAMTAQAAEKPPAERLPPSAPWVKLACVAGSRTADWSFADGADAPDYVVVLRHADGVAIDPPTVPSAAGAGGCGA